MSMYEYSFNLDWNELPEELREEKITLYLEHQWEEENESGKDLEDYVNDFGNRQDAERSIEARFPIYF